MADSFRSSNGRNITVLKDGRILSYDPATNALAEVASAELPAEAWIQNVAKAKDNNWLYLGLKVPPTSIETKSEGEIIAVNASNFSPGRSNKTSQRFSYLYVSPNGQWLYAVNTQDANILIIEAATLKEVSAMTDLGETPSLIVESP